MAITSELIAEQNRLDFLPGVFGPRYFLVVEHAVFHWMQRLCSAYRGGYWDFLRLSNEGGYLRLDTTDRLRIFVDGNGFTGTVTADAAGIIATLFALCELANRTGDVLVNERYFQLRDFVAQHAERAAIYAAID